MFTFVAYAAAFVSVVVAGLYIYLRNALLFWKKQGVRTLENHSVAFGDFYEVMAAKTSIGERYKALYNAFGDEPYGGVYFFKLPILLLKDLDLIKQVFVRDFSNFHSRGMYSDPKRPLSGNLFFLSGPRWRRMRVKLTPTFTTGKVKMMLETLVECANQLNSYLEKEIKKDDVIDIKEVLARLGTDVVASVAFGIQCNSIHNPDAEFRTMGKLIFEPTLIMSLRNMSYFFMHFFVKWFGLGFTDPKVEKFMQKIIHDTVNYREKNGISRPDFLNLLIELKNAKMTEEERNGVQNGKTAEKDTKPITMSEIVDQAFVFFAAGYETTSTTTGFCLYELTRHPDIQTKVIEEIEEALKQSGGKVTYELLANSMRYTEKVINETLRFYPAVPFLTREASEAMELDAHGGKPLKVCKGQLVGISVSGIHMDPKYFPDPEVFDPERFTPENIAARHHFAHIPFGEGPRICIGMRFALIQIKLSLLNILNRYRVETCPKTPEKIKLDAKTIVPFPEGGLYMRLVPRADRISIVS